MERASSDHKGQQQRTATSFSDLFGDRKDSAASRSGGFPDVFTTQPPSSAAKGSGGSQYEPNSWRKDGNGRSGDRTRNSSSGVRNQTDHSQGSSAQRVDQSPSNFDLSVYYGARDSFLHSPPSKAPANAKPYSRDSSQEERSWWQGSFYY